MAVANVAGNGQQKTVEQILCLEGLTDEINGQLTFILFLNSFLSVSAFLGNALTNCSSQRVFGSSAVQTPASLSCNN